MLSKVLVPGTFDPITSGHIDVIARAAHIFDQVVVGVAASTNKPTKRMFTLDERTELARAALADFDNVSVTSFDILLVDFAREIGAGAIVKGLRVVTDFESEFQQAALNYHLGPDIETLFIMSSPEHMYLSSSVVREIAQLKGDVSELVPPAVAAELVKRYGCRG